MLREGLARLGIPFAAQQLDQVRIFLQELERWNRRYGFIARGEGAEGRELISRHVLDSLSAWPIISAIECRGRIADVASGAGFPGIPLAVFLPDSRFTLVEPSATKTAFLRNVAILARLENVEVAEQRLEDLDRRFDLVVFRAFSPICRQLPALKRIVEPHGTIIAYKGRLQRVMEELDGADADPWNLRIIPVRVPFLEEERHLVVISPSSSGA
ncbi:MAG: 16S rRNA (guanine(527)-N(7))-methyltransferase RsmG [Spirochaetales bacterium]|nr:16S rRNA (guanine(527)-N(7))-methyltransferase RsmG [Spirochaetales bacterium]